MGIIASSGTLPAKELCDQITKRSGIWLSLPYVYRLAAPYHHRQLEIEDQEAALPKSLTSTETQAEQATKDHGEPPCTEICEEDV